VAELWRFGCICGNQIAIVRVEHLGRLCVGHNGDCLRDSHGEEQVRGNETH
jgi:hypothetical protein